MNAIAKEIWLLVRETYTEWSDDNVSRLSSSLAYYTVFCVAPLLVIVVRVSALIFGQSAANDQLKGQLGGLLGVNIAGAITSMVAQASAPGAGGGWAMFFSIIVFGYAATLLFDEFQDAINSIWNVERTSQSSWRRSVQHELFSLAMVLGTIVLFLASLVISTLLPIINDVAKGGGSMRGRPVEVIVSMATFTIVFALAFKFMSAARVAWQDVWVGAAITSTLFTAGKYAIGAYLARSGGSIYGATGAVAVLLIWVYYSAQVLFIGAEFTQVFAKRNGRPIKAGKTVQADRAILKSQSASNEKPVSLKTGD